MRQHHASHTMTRLLLLDAYALIFRAYYGFIKNPRINSQGENTSAVLGFVNILEEVMAKYAPTHLGVAFDLPGGTFRSQRYPAYKAQRDETPEGIRFATPWIKRILAAYGIPVIEVAGFEADDIIGTLATEAGRQGIETLMVTPDKDYGQLVGESVRMLRPGSKGDFEVMGPEEVCGKWGIANPRQVIDILGLMGDASDNIPGCPGVGEKTASKLIQQFGSIEALLAATDQLKGALRTKVEGAAEQIRLSRWLAEIVTDVPVELDMEALAVKAADEAALADIYNRLEMRSLIKRRTAAHDAAATAAATRPQPVQGDLFADSGAADDTTTTAGSGSTQPGSYRADTTAAAKALAAYSPDTASYTLADTPAKRAALLATLLAATEVSLDTETTSTDAMQAELVGLSFATREGEGAYVPVPPDRDAATAIVAEFRPLYEHPAIVKVGQNLKYDLNVLAAYGISLAPPMFDTMLAHYVLQPEMHHGMDYLADAYLGYKTIHFDEVLSTSPYHGDTKKPKTHQPTMRDVPVERACTYAAEDADITLRLKHTFEPMLEQEGAARLFANIEMPLMPVLADMERTGVCLDTASLAEAGRLHAERMRHLEDDIRALAGGEFNISSPKQVGELLFDRLHLSDHPRRTKGGQYVTSEEVLEKLRPKHDIVGKILDYRAAKKLVSTYIDALPRLINPRTGHIHTSFNQSVTATGRLSSSNPNLQNIPVRTADGKEIRKAFVPEPGQLFFSADYSQIELRLMAHLSGDEGLIEDFRLGHDIHAATAAKVFHKDIADVTREERSRAKTANFGIIYGITAFGLTERLGISRTESRQLIDQYFDTYPRVQAYMQESIARAREHGYTETICGRRCYLRDINSANATVRGFAERNAINAPIQGSAADIIKIAMVRIHRRLEAEGLRSKMILQVHDELNFSVHPDERDRVEAIVIEEMQAAYTLRVPLIADCGWGANWLEAH